MSLFLLCGASDCRLCALGTAEAALLPFHASTPYRSQVSEVQITFSATDQNQHAVQTLNASDFAVVDKDLVVRNFRSFSHAQYVRLEVAVLVDTSGSVLPRFKQVAAEVAHIISQSSSVPEESLSIISFHGLEPSVICKGNCQPSSVTGLAPTGSAVSMTPLFDSLKFAAESLSQTSDARSRKVVILFSDGDDTISRSSSIEAIEALVANDIPVYAVNVDRTTSSSGAAFLEKLSLLTGGRNFQLNEGANLVLDAVLEDFRSSYRVTYRLPHSAAGFHMIRIVPTHNLNLNFRCRRGYFDSPDSR